MRASILLTAFALLAVALGTPAEAGGTKTLRGKYVAVTIGSKVFDVRDYGAKNDGHHNNTDAVDAAFAAAAKAKGGTVLFTGGGKYLLDTITFQSSNTALQIDTGTTVLISNDRDKWPGQQNIITANNLNNLAMLGSGVVNGQGEVWWNNRNDFRPKMAYFHGCTNVYVTGLTFTNSPNHNLELYADYCELDNVTITAPPSSGVKVESHNTDAVDVHGSPFYIHDCHFSVGDDNVAVHVNDTLVEDCVFGTGHGASIGSIMDGWIKNITFTGIKFAGTTQALRIKTRQGGHGYVKDVTYSNLQMEDVGTTILVTMYYQDDEAAVASLNSSAPLRPAAPAHHDSTTMRLSNIVFKDITAKNSAQAGVFQCDTSYDSCTNFSMYNVQQQGAQQGYSCQGVKGSQKDTNPSVCFKKDN